MKKSLSIAILSALACLSACSDSSDACKADVNEIEQQRQALCQNKTCGDIVFIDACNATHTKSCGTCLAGESCTPQGRCAACTSDAQCPNGYQCNADYACEQREDYCENNADCDGKGGGICTDNICVSLSASCGDGDACDVAGGERCIYETCKQILTLDACSATGSTTLAASVVQAVHGFDGPENIFEYTATADGEVMVIVTPADLSYDPAVYALSRLTPTPVLLPSTGGDVVTADEGNKGESELLMFTAAAGATYYIVVTSDASKQDGQYRQGRYEICLESMACSQTCEVK